jgi:methyltransferase-like protein/SAM-dependent methyltransferase
MTVEHERTSYDEVPYESFPYVQSHPDRLAVIATLFGLRPATVSRCSVLELGCAAGGNLIPLAANFPNSSFLGIDLSGVQVRQGQELVRKLQLPNIELRHLDILDVGPDLGCFDYILCHGVFSWVPPAVQDRVLDICKKSLAPQGVAYVSYNTYPGWHLRRILRDMMLYQARGYPEPATRVRQARNLLDFFARMVAQKNTPYNSLLEGDLKASLRQADFTLYHEHLEKVNDPMYFHQFVERAAARGLQFLAESDLYVPLPRDFAPDVQELIQALQPDRIHMEQYMDIVQDRTFRQTLLCHDRHAPVFSMAAERLAGFHLSSRVRLVEPPADNAAGASSARKVKVDFKSPDGVTMSSDDPLLQEAMHYLVAAWPASVPFERVVEAARQRVARDRPPDPATASDDHKKLGQTFSTFYASASANLVELHLAPPRVVTTITAKPLASPVARAQAETGHWVTNQRHSAVWVGDFERHLLRRLDGEHDRSALREVIQKQVSTGQLVLEKGGQPVTGDQLANVVDHAIESQLRQFVQNALLVG